MRMIISRHISRRVTTSRSRTPTRTVTELLSYSPVTPRRATVARIVSSQRSCARRTRRWRTSSPAACRSRASRARRGAPRRVASTPPRPIAVFVRTLLRDARRLFLVTRYALSARRAARALSLARARPFPFLNPHPLRTQVTPRPSPPHPHPSRQVHAPRPAARRRARADGGACVWVVVGSSSPTRRLVVVWFVFSDGV